MVKLLRVTFSGVFRDILEVTVTQEEFDKGVQAGVSRHTDALIKKHARADGTKTTWDEDINGAIGEYIASIALEKEWNLPGGVGQPDLVGGIEVRTITSSDRSLLIKFKDKEDRPFVLVVGTGNHLVWRVTGWIYGRDGKKPEYNAGPYYLVDQAQLNPILDLKEVTSDDASTR
jgi:hypothetical protein